MTPFSFNAQMETNDRAKTGDSCSSAAWLRGVQNGVFKNDKFFQNSSDNVHNFWTFSPTSKVSYHFNYIKFTYIVPR